MSSGASAPCPPDSALMIAWSNYKTTEEYLNSHKWATQYIPPDDPEELERIRQSGANPFTYQLKLQAVGGSLWAMFSEGWRAAGGSDPFKKKPTIEELEVILREDDQPIEIMPNGSICVKR